VAEIGDRLSTIYRRYRQTDMTPSSSSYFILQGGKSEVIHNGPIMYKLLIKPKKIGDAVNCCNEKMFCSTVDIPKHDVANAASWIVIL